MKRLIDPQTIDFFDTLARVLIRCAIMAYLLLLLTVGVFTLAGDTMYRLNSNFFDLSKHELELIIYGFIVMTKSVVFLFFLIPWAAIRLVLKKSKTAP
jgi:hypothetical protein